MKNFIQLAVLVCAVAFSGIASAAVNQDLQAFPVRKVAASASLEINDFYVGVTSTAAARTISTTANDQVCGRVIVINDESNGAGTNNITFDPAGSVTVNGSATVAISTNGGELRLICDCTNWFSF